MGSGRLGWETRLGVLGLEIREWQKGLREGRQRGEGAGGVSGRAGVEGGRRAWGIPGRGKVRVGLGRGVPGRLGWEVRSWRGSRDM